MLISQYNPDLKQWGINDEAGWRPYNQAELDYKARMAEKRAQTGGQQGALMAAAAQARAGNYSPPPPDTSGFVIGGVPTGTKSMAAYQATQAPRTTAKQPAPQAPQQQFAAPQGMPQAPRYSPQAGARSPVLSPITNQVSGNYAMPRMDPSAWYNNWQGANPFSMNGNAQKGQQSNRAVSPGFVQGNMPSNFTGMSGQSGFQDQLAQMLAQYQWPKYF
jgi:hypothetical protein